MLEQGNRSDSGAYANYEVAELGRVSLKMMRESLPGSLLEDASNALDRGV